MINIHKVNHQNGTGLIEVLVSLLILAISILGYVAVQGNALRLSDESSQRTQSLALMRDIGEKIRINPIGLVTYRDQLVFPAIANTPPTEGCGLLGTSATQCTNAQIATAEAYIFRKEMIESGYTVSMIECPTTDGKTIDNVMYSNCLIAGWGETTPTLGTDDDDSDGSMDCLNADGAYHPHATCMLMELT